MARKPNYGFERRQRERAKAEKKAARLEAKVRKREQRSAESPDGENDGQAGETPPTPEEAE